MNMEVSYNQLHLIFLDKNKKIEEITVS